MASENGSFSCLTPIHWAQHIAYPRMALTSPQSGVCSRWTLHFGETSSGTVGIGTSKKNKAISVFPWERRTWPSGLSS